MFVQDLFVLLFDELFLGVDHVSAMRIEVVFVELRVEGCALLVVTYDVVQVCVWLCVLCVNYG